MRILQLGDTHVTVEGLAAGGGAHLATLLERLQHVGPLDLVAVVGDLSDDYSPESYAIVREVVEGFAGPRGAQAVYVMGNHDDRTVFRSVLGDGLGGPADDVAEDAPVFGVRNVAGWRVITLDTSIPMDPHGFLDARQLDWLHQQLMFPAGNGSIIVMHHPPVDSVSPLLAPIQLANPDMFADAIKDGDVKLIMAGHYHHMQMDHVHAGGQNVPVLVSPGIKNIEDVVAQPGWVRVTDGFGALLIDLNERGPRVHVVEKTSEVEQFSLSPEQVAEKVAGWS